MRAALSHSSESQPAVFPAQSARSASGSATILRIPRLAWTCRLQRLRAVPPSICLASVAVLVVEGRYRRRCHHRRTHPLLPSRRRRNSASWPRPISSSFAGSRLLYTGLGSGRKGFCTMTREVRVGHLDGIGRRRESWDNIRAGWLHGQTYDGERASILALSFSPSPSLSLCYVSAGCAAWNAKSPVGSRT